jgi:hypothetical protein
MWSVSMSYLEDNWNHSFKSSRSDRFRTRAEAGLNTSTVTLRVVRGDEKESLKSETVKYGLESQRTQNR